MSKPSAILQFQDISVFKNNTYLLKNISFKICDSELITIVGKNGMGKSTLCKVLTGNIKASHGSIIKKDNLKISYVPQINNFNVMLPISVMDFLVLNKKNKELSKDDYNVFDLLGINPLLKKNLHNLSGGEQQKVILTRALTSTPDLLVLDEPVSFIDFANKGGVYDVINYLRKHKKFSVVMVSHDINLVLNDTTWVICLNNGEIGCQGKSIHMNNEDEFKKIFGDKWGYYQHHDAL